MDEADEKVLVVATRLFAELGYDTTTLGMITDAVGKEAEESKLLRLGKRQLYRHAFGRLHAMETARLEAAAREAPDDPEGVHHLVDVFIDFVTEHPEFPALWSQRSLKDAIDLRFPEKEFPPPLLTVLTSHSWQGLRPDIDLELISWMIIWTVADYVFSSRVSGRDFPFANFRPRLHALLDQVL
ncbi:TetR/AcrR family transcriptional regulator [Actinomadura keratinilytica]|uniref:TetR family transcriptional regulator n=1 Tax=Actinomadura keratinilytica TaxID=547461 RepID=A0ABP7Z8V5_9ACTN